MMSTRSPETPLPSGNACSLTRSTDSIASMRRLLAPILGLLLVASSCGSGAISASDCDGVVDESLALIQRLIDDVDQEFGDVTVQEFIALGEDLPSLDRFAEDAATIDDIAAELGCTRDQISTAVDARAGELTAETDLGRFLINAIRTGGL